MRSRWALLFHSPAVRRSREREGRLPVLPSESSGDCVNEGGGLWSRYWGGGYCSGGYCGGGGCR